MSKKALMRIPLENLMDLKIDYAFKQLFGSEKNKAITIVFLNAILKRTGRDTIKEVTFKNIEIGGEHDGDKQSRLDILVTTQDDHHINVEIQFTNKYDMVKRSLYYWAQIHNDQLESGISYIHLNPTITVNILNFNLFPKTDLFHTTFHLYEDEEKFRLDDQLELHFIEIPKLLRQWKAQLLNPWEDVLARWLLLLGIVDHRNGRVYEELYKELEEIAMGDEHLQDAFASWQEISVSPESLPAYRARLKQVLDDEAMVIEAKYREEAALVHGKELGIELGAQGEKERMACDLLKMKVMDIEAIAELTKLTLERIEELRTNMKLS